MNPRTLALVIAASVVPLLSCTSQPELATTGFLEVEPGIEIYFQRLGDGPQAVMIPAGMYLAEEFVRLAAPERTLFFYDQRGRGKSTTITNGAKLSLEHELADLEALRQHFSFERVSLIGWSYLGGVVVQYALAYAENVERIVQLGPIPPRRDPHLQMNEATLASRRSEDDRAEMTVLMEKMDRGEDTEQDRRTYWRILHKAVLYDPRSQIQLRSDYYTLKNERPGNVWGFHHPTVVGSFGNWDWRVELAEVSAPVLTIHGDHDALPLEGSKEWVESLPNARLLVVSQAGHLPWVEKPEIVFPAIDGFLKGKWPDGAESRP